MAKEKLMCFKPKFSPDFLDLCERKVCKIEKLVEAEDLLNERQCRDLSSKLSKTILNLQQLVKHCSGSTDLRPAFRNLYRWLKKAKALVKSCGEEKWWIEAVFQNQNQNAFQDILLEVGLAYNVIYEQAKSKSKDCNDLRDPSVSVFAPASTSDVKEDQQDLKTRLEELVKDPSGVKVQGQCLAGDAVAKAQSLAEYLLKVQCALEQPLSATLRAGCSEIMWQKETEPTETWGKSEYLGSGATHGAVMKTEWLGIPCAKKVHECKEHELFFLKEAGIMAHVKHPCIINFICCSNGEAKGDCYIAMELMEKSLSEMIRDQKNRHFPLHVVIDVIVQIAQGMLYLHDRGVAHRDLKPQNVVVKRVTSDPEDLYYVKLVDFGTSKTEVEVSKSMMVTSLGIGTTTYRAPELHPSANKRRRGKVDWFKADVFSFAMTCVHVLSLVEPFSEMNVGKVELCDEILNGRRPNLPKDPKICPDELVALLKDCWNNIPHKRPSFMDICTRLEVIRHKDLRGCLMKKDIELGASLDFIKTKMEEQSSRNRNIQKLQLGDIHEEVENENKESDNVSILNCTCGCALELLSQAPSTYGGRAICNMCREDIDGELYHCETCQFDAHPYCAEIKNKVEMDFHEHTLHLLVQNYYKDKPDAICYFCGESVQESEWVYQCEECDLDVHASCTKFSKNIMQDYLHEHHLLARQCPPGKKLLCRNCNGNIKDYTWHYTCSVPSCGFTLHPLCTTVLWNPLCIFDDSHRFSLQTIQVGFHCGRCGALGFSWNYDCALCDVKVHPDCMDHHHMNDAKEDWYGACEKFMMNDGMEDDNTKMNKISELLDMMPVNNGVTESSLDSRPSAVMKKVQPTIQRLISEATHNRLKALRYDVDLQKQIAAETAERINAKKVAVEEGRQTLSRNLLAMLDGLEKIVVDQQSLETNTSKDAIQMIAATYEKLKRRQQLVKEQIAMQVQSKMSPGPRIAVFFRVKNEKLVLELLTSLRADMKDVYIALLCEEPGDEHIILETSAGWEEVGEERAKKLQPSLQRGLQVVMRFMSTLEPDMLQKFRNLEYVSRPFLGAYADWDLRAIQFYGSMDLPEDEESVEALEQAESSAAEWLQSHGGGTDGLQCVRYKEAGGDELWKQRWDNMAWLCKKHVISGLKDGTILECYPRKFYNLEYNNQLRVPHENSD